MLTDSEVNKRFRHAPTLGYNKRVEWLADQIILNFSILCVMIRTGIVFFIISRQHFFFLATLVLKKEQERQEEDREKETLKKITSLFFFAIFGNARHLVTWSLVSLISPIDRYKPVPGVYHAKRSVIENGVIVAEEFEKKRENEGDLRQIAEVPILPRFSIPPLARARSTQEIHMSGEKGK